mmetsp:Transcript_28421/g.45650  ORF Transcript_28421/g.45650 Transcript_28421/m.45650 type:complete len:88 (-) Transcript_28421:46-309(-)
MVMAAARTSAGPCHILRVLAVAELPASRLELERPGGVEACPAGALRSLVCTLCAGKGNAPTVKADMAPPGGALAVAMALFHTQWFEG